MPYRLAPPANLPAVGGNQSLIHLPSHGIEAELLLRVHSQIPSAPSRVRFAS